jgi:hypothetical protein
MTKIKEFIQEVVDMLDWFLAGCPQPVKIPVKVDDASAEEQKSSRRSNDR